MADAAATNPPPTKPTTKPTAPFVAFDVTKAAAADEARRLAQPSSSRGCRWLRRLCCVVAIAGALTAAAVLALSLTVLRVRDPTLSMVSVSVTRFSVRLDSAAAHPLRINLTLAGAIVIRNPNYESMRFGASATEIFLDVSDDDEPSSTTAAAAGEPVGVGRAPAGEVAARGASRVDADVDVLVDRVAPAVVARVLFGGGDVRLSTRTAVDGRLSVLGGIYGRRTVRVAMRCQVKLRVSAVAVAVNGNPACVADFGR